MSSACDTGTLHVGNDEAVTGVVSRVIPFSCVDGPGSRFVIFLQGCNFNCKNCHNPHTIGHCDHCGDCVPRCPAGALTINHGKVHWQQNLCQSCDQCVDHCPSSSSPMTQALTVGYFIQQLQQKAPFISGVTVSGGEATVQLKFIKALFTAIKQHPQLRHLTCLVDSNGHLPVSAWQTLLPVMDGAMIDLKAMDDSLHRWLTGRGNQRILETIGFLHGKNKLTELRLLAIPGITDTREEINAIKALIHSLGDDVPIRVNAFSNKAVRGEARGWTCFPEEQKAGYLR